MNTLHSNMSQRHGMKCSKGKIRACIHTVESLAGTCCTQYPAQTTPLELVITPLYFDYGVLITYRVRINLCRLIEEK